MTFSWLALLGSSWLLMSCTVALSSGSITSSVTPLVIGHRGLLALYPENTMISFQAALDAGADGLECDLHLTKDGVIVLMHDDTLNRTTNCTGFVEDYNLVDLQSCNANNAAVFGDKYGFVPIPLFEDVIALISQPQYMSFVVMDLKEHLILGSKIAPILQRYGAESRAIASCWTFAQLADAFANLSSSPRQYLTSSVPDTTQNPSLWGTWMSQGLRGFSIFYTNITTDFVTEAHARLLPVVAWTVDDEQTILQLVENGVDGIITDNTIAVKAWLDPVQIAMKEAIANDGQQQSGTSTSASSSATVAGSVGTLVGMFVGVAGMWFMQQRKLAFTHSPSSPHSGGGKDIAYEALSR